MFVRRKTLERERREFLRREVAWTAERREMLNRIMYMADKPWMMPDYAATPTETKDEVEEDFTYPEQLALS